LKIYKVSDGHDVEGLYQQLQDPALWNGIKLRTEHPQSPHREVSDIWVRYNDFSHYAGDMQAFNGPHESVWYPIAEKLTEARRLSEQIAGDRPLGAVLITKIPAGKQVHPHIDGGWHAHHYDKHAIQIRGNDKQRFVVQNEELVTQTGDEFWFNNSVPHWVINDSEFDRITLIVCIRSN
jgi:uncharacterized RmlC-like cupin family protein